jgi:hypothetical protein
VDKDIEFTISIPHDSLTCGWLLSEVTRRYVEALNKIKTAVIFPKVILLGNYYY